MAKALRIANPNYRYKLKAKMIEAGYRSQNEFAEAAGLDRNEVSRIINGLMPTRPGLKKLAEGLGVTIFEAKQLL